MTPRKLGSFRLDRQIACSRMSSLWLADRDGGGPVVVKILARGSRAPAPEAAVAAALRHPNLVELVERGEAEGESFVVMARLEGASLARIMEACTPADTMPPSFWAYVIARAADGLEALHELRGAEGGQLELVHGDVSPQNVFVTLAGEVKVLDFDLVRRAGQPPAWELAGELAGTYPYLAPERVERRPADRRADLFALGVILYEATTLTRLFKGCTDSETLEKIRRHAVRPPHVLAPEIPRRLESIILRAIRRDPDERYGTAAELAADLDLFATSREGGGWSRSEIEDALGERVVSLVDTSAS